MNFVKHTNNWYWGTSIVIITEDCQGFVRLAFEQETEDNPLITGLSVTENYRKKGYGTALINECIKTAKENGFDKVYLYAEKNSDAHRLYTKLGFKTESIMITMDELAKKADIHMIRMIKEI